MTENVRNWARLAIGSVIVAAPWVSLFWLTLIVLCLLTPES